MSYPFPFEDPRGSPNYFRKASFLNRTLHVPTTDTSVSDRSQNNRTEKESIDTKQNAILRHFAETTTLQGPILIIKSENKCQRGLWIGAFLIAIGCWILHSYFLITTYLAYETSSKVTIGYDTLEFPSVTICNVNPVLNSTVEYYGSDELFMFLTGLAPPTAYARSRPDDGGEMDRTLPADDGQMDGSGPDGGGQADGSATGDDDPGDSETMDDTTSGGDAVSDSDPRNGDQPNQGRKKRQAGEPGGPMSFGDYAYLDYTSDEVDENYGEGSVSGDVDRTIKFKTLYSSLPKENRTKLGTNREMMILQCSFNGLECNSSDFTLYQTSEYGNCYTFNSAQTRNSSLKTRLSGATYGLNLRLFSQFYDYVPGLSEGIGFRVSIHNYGTLPFVEDSGLAVNTGTESFIALRRFNTSLLGGKYGQCNDKGEFDAYYKKKYTYTIQACLGTCTDRTIAAKCKCYRATFFHLYRSSDLQSLPSCSSTNATAACSNRFSQAFSYGKFDCGCKQGCRSVEYEFTTSSHRWPQSSYWFELVDQVATVDEAGWDYLDEQKAEDRDYVMELNFAKLRIFYRELNFESIAEREDYEMEQFISDMGGAVGLYVGATIITFIELVHLLCQCGCVCMKKAAKSSQHHQPQEKQQHQKGQKIPKARNYHQELGHNNNDRYRLPRNV